MGSSQHGFRELKSCLSLLGVLYVEVTNLVDEGRAVAVAYLAFSKGFGAPSNDTAIEKLRNYGFL